MIKRNGERESVSFDKILKRIQKICQERGLINVNSVEIVKETISAIHNNITTSELDTFAAQKCAEKILIHPEYNKLAAAICVSNLQKKISSLSISSNQKSRYQTFRQTTEYLYQNQDNQGRSNPLISEEYYELVIKNHELIEAEIDHTRDYLFDYFGIETLIKSYLMKSCLTKSCLTKSCLTKSEKIGKKELVESPQHMFMRVALGIHGKDLSSGFQVYDMISKHHYTHATPTLYNSGTRRPQLASCFLLGMDDNLESIFETITDIAHISKWAGGIGVHMTDIRASNSEIRGTRGKSNGVVPFIKIINECLRAIDQGGGLRKGAGAIYLDIWHADVFKFCDLRKSTGAEELRARDLHLALMIPDLFMERVRSGGKWSLMCPDQSPGLSTSYGNKFRTLYEKYEQNQNFVQQVEAIDLWNRIITAQIEGGEPYILYKDAINLKNNQSNLGTIQSSNLCCEITEFSSQNEIAVCNLASICLPSYLELIDQEGNKEDQKGNKEDQEENKEDQEGNKEDQEGNTRGVRYNYQKLHEAVKIAVISLDRVIDCSYYKLEKTKYSNFRNRPIGLGVQGLADVYARMMLPFDSIEAKKINKRIFETIYHGALTSSIELARKYGKYETFEGSPFSEGKVQWHLWGLTQEDLKSNWEGKNGGREGGWDWDSLLKDLKKYGCRNSLLTALMPTATTSQIMGCNECFEPITSNLFRRKTLTGEYVIVNNILVETLIRLGLWTDSIREEIIYDKGSIQNIKEIPENVRNVFKTAYELGMKPIIEQAADRGPFIDQSQSMNLYSAKADPEKITNAHFLGWSRGLKTGSYYIRTLAAVDPIKFGLDPVVIRKIRNKRGSRSELINPPNNYSQKICEEDCCEMCSS